MILLHMAWEGWGPRAAHPPRGQSLCGWVSLALCPACQSEGRESGGAFSGPIPNPRRVVWETFTPAHLLRALPLGVAAQAALVVVLDVQPH